MATRLWDVQAALVSLFTAAAAEAKVFPGPRIGADAPRKFVLVGTDGGDDGLVADEDGMSAQQAASSKGPGTWRDEDGAITCSAWSWSGARTVGAAREACKALLAECELAVHGDRSLGGVLVPPGLAEITAHSIRESQHAAGPVVRVVFTVSYSALITS